VEFYLQSHIPPLMVWSARTVVSFTDTLPHFDEIRILRKLEISPYIVKYT